MPHVIAAAAAVAATISLSALSFVTAGETEQTFKQDRLPQPSAVSERLQASPIPPQAGPTPPQAGLSLCGERDAMVADLAEQFHEAPLATGMVDEKAVLEIFVSAAGSWTILATGTDGKSCVMAVGEGFEPSMPEPGVGA